MLNAQKWFQAIRKFYVELVEGRCETALGVTRYFHETSNLEHAFCTETTLTSFRKSTPPQNCQTNISISNSKQQVDDLVGESTFQN